MLDTFRHNRPLYRSNIRRDSTCTTTTTTATYNTFGSLTQRSYLPTYKQAISIYKAIQSSHPNMLTDECIRKFPNVIPYCDQKKKKINRRPNFFTFFPNFRNVSVVCRTSLGEWSGIHRRGNQQSYAKCRKHYIAWYPQDIFGWCIGACIHQ